jgi:hypothetical protein
MTTPDVEQELERLFSVAREATVPDAGAKARIRAGLEPRLAAAGAGPRSSRPAWLGLGAAVLGVCAGALWLTSAPPVSVPPSRPVVVLEPTKPASEAPAVPPAALEVAPPLAPSASAAPPKARPAASLSAAKAAPSAAIEDAAAEELTLVRQMQQALRAGNAGQALSLADVHARRFPRGTLAEEREGVRAVARCKLAPPGDRADILDAFSHRFGSSPYASRVKQACQ